MYRYWVRIQWQGQKYAKFFSDRRYGDGLAALDAAIEWRNATERAVGKPRTEQLVIGAPSSNNTGVVGAGFAGSVASRPCADRTSRTISQHRTPLLCT